MTKDQNKMQEIVEDVIKGTIEFRKTLDRITRQLDEWEAEDLEKEGKKEKGGRCPYNAQGTYCVDILSSAGCPFATSCLYRAGEKK